MGIPTNEQETVIQFNRSSDKASIWTSDSTMMTKLDKHCAKENSLYKCTDVGYSQDDNSIVCKQYETKKQLVSFRSQKVKRELTEKQRQALSERLQKQRALAKNTGKED